MYLLNSHSEGTFYFGCATDLSRRLVEHNGSFEETKTRKRSLKWSPRMLQRVLNPAAVGRHRQVVG